MRIYTQANLAADYERYGWPLSTQQASLRCEECGQAVERVMILEQHTAGDEGECVKICVQCAHRAWADLHRAEFEKP